MEAYIKSFSSFYALRQVSTTDWSLVLDSLDSQGSSITVGGDDIPGTIAGNWLILNGIPMRIEVVTPGKGLTRFTLSAAEEIFNRQLLADYDATGTIPTWPDSTIGGFIQRIIEREWVNQADARYATSYISVTNLDNTPFVAPELDDNGIWNLLAYIRWARVNFNISLTWTVERNGLRVTIHREPVTLHPLVLGDGHTQLASSSFASQRIAKVTVIQPHEVEPEEEPENDAEPVFEMTSTDWFLCADGTATDDPDATNRVDGEWITIVIGDGDDQAEKVQEEFAKNGESHKVELYTDVQMAVGDRFRVKLNGELFEGTVVRRFLKKGDRRVLYTSGELITTIQERVHQTAAAQQGGYTGDGSGQMYAVGDIFITTRTGNPAQLLGYGAWEQIQGRFLFAADSSHAVKSRGGSAEQTLTQANLPSDVNFLDGDAVYASRDGESGSSYGWFASYVQGAIKPLGSGTAFSIIPPYFAVFVWLRKE